MNNMPMFNILFFFCLTIFREMLASDIMSLPKIIFK